MSTFVIRVTPTQAGPTLAIKDSIDVAGYPTQVGSRAYRDVQPATRHADSVQRLLDAGWQLAGKTVLHELAFGVTGINEWSGTPTNPQAPLRVPGGSSSGSASAVAAGEVDLALGTDTGGSVRVPAACCGIYGLKPTFARISRVGVWPAESSLDCVGPFARDMAGIVAAMTVIAPGFALDDSAPTRPIRIGVVRTESEPTIVHALEQALALTDWHCEAVELPLLPEAFQAGLTVINAETWAACGHLTGHDVLGADVEQRLLRARHTTARDVAEAEGVRRAFGAEVDALLQRFDALVLPTLPRLPPLLEDVRQGASVIDMTALVRPFNLSGHPALSAPVPLPESSLSVGLQLIGRHHQDEHLCTLALELERALAPHEPHVPPVAVTLEENPA